MKISLARDSGGESRTEKVVSRASFSPPTIPSTTCYHQTKRERRCFSASPSSSINCRVARLSTLSGSSYLYHMDRPDFTTRAVAIVFSIAFFSKQRVCMHTLLSQQWLSPNGHSRLELSSCRRVWRIHAGFQEHKLK